MTKTECKTLEEAAKLLTDFGFVQMKPRCQCKFCQARRAAVRLRAIAEKYKGKR